MDKEDLSPHVDEIMEAIGDKVPREKISEELERYIDVFRLNIQTAKRTILKKFGDLTEEPVISANLKKLSEIQPGEMSVNFVGKIITVNDKEIEARGEKKRILYGLIGDDTGTLSYTVWDIPEKRFDRGDVISVRNAYSKEYNGRVQLNFGSRTGIKEIDEEIELADIPISTPKPAKIGEIDDDARSVEVTGRIVSIEKKIISGDSGPREIFTGLIADETGRIRFTSWGDTRLKEDDVVCISGASVRFWRGMPQLNFDERAEITRVKGDFPDAKSLMESQIAEIFSLNEGAGAIDVTINGVIMQIREGSGLIFRCPECKRVLQKGSCRIHGKVDGVADLRVKGVIDDGTGALTAIINRDLTEELIDMTIDECIEKAREVMDYDSIKDILEDRLLAQPLQLRGNVTVDEYGPMMIAQSADRLDPDIKSEAEKLVIRLEESE
ncbi:MAG TPA: hypothetical protein ENN25_02220 [Euryarchaeota archaeon]|nr:hypothetical protein [Euryarchaeota archaeon]